jgi:hypothetical protein
MELELVPLLAQMLVRLLGLEMVSQWVLVKVTRMVHMSALEMVLELVK